MDNTNVAVAVMFTVEPLDELAPSTLINAMVPGLVVGVPVNVKVMSGPDANGVAFNVVPSPTSMHERLLVAHVMSLLALADPGAGAVPTVTPAGRLNVNWIPAVELVGVESVKPTVTTGPLTDGPSDRVSNG